MDVLPWDETFTDNENMFHCITHLQMACCQSHRFVCRI